LCWITAGGGEYLDIRKGQFVYIFFETVHWRHFFLLRSLYLSLLAKN
jgi:hypothetical protein